MDRVQSHYHFLKQALLLAKSRRGFCAPNPSVGAVVVRNGKLLASGKHWAFGEPHAEIDALKKIQYRAENATLYITLEPCCHQGKTPPCTAAIIQSGIRSVYYGCRDPNPKVAGQGDAELQKAGLICQHLTSPDIENFYRSYCHWEKYKVPWVTAKIAMSLDGKTANQSERPLKITRPTLQYYTHQKRYHSDAILTGINTIIKDNPKLNARLDNKVYKKPLYILDSALRLPIESNIFNTARSITAFYDAALKNLQKNRSLLESLGVQFIDVQKNQYGLNLMQILKKIGEEGMHDLWVESGSQLFQSLWLQKLLHRAFIYIAPKVFGNGPVIGLTEEMDFAKDAHDIHWEAIGQNLVCQLDYAKC